MTSRPSIQSTSPTATLSMDLTPWQKYRLCLSVCVGLCLCVCMYIFVRSYVYVPKSGIRILSNSYWFQKKSEGIW